MTQEEFDKWFQRHWEDGKDEQQREYRDDTQYFGEQI